MEHRGMIYCDNNFQRQKSRHKKLEPPCIDAQWVNSLAHMQTFKRKVYTEKNKV